MGLSMCASPAHAPSLAPEERIECYGRGVPTKVVCAECMKMCCLGGLIRVKLSKIEQKGSGSV